MRLAGCTLVLTALVLGLTSAPGFAERNLVLTLDRSFDVCPERPVEPVWMQEIPLRQAYQRVLVQDIYRAQNLERIVETSSCDCEIQFPSSDAYNRRANAARTAAKAICDAAGNW